MCKTCLRFLFWHDKNVNLILVSSENFDFGFGITCRVKITYNLYT